MQEVEGISDFVFTNTLGRPYAVNAVNSALDNIIKAYNKWDGAQAVKERREPRAELLQISEKSDCESLYDRI